MLPEPPIYYLHAPDPVGEEQLDGRFTPCTGFVGRADPLPVPFPTPVPPPVPAPAPLAFTVPFNAFNWREFSEWQRAEYGSGRALSAGSDRDQALNGKAITRTIRGKYGVPLTPQQQAQAARAAALRGHVAPLRMTTKTFSLGQASVVRAALALDESELP